MTDALDLSRSDGPHAPIPVVFLINVDWFFLSHFVYLAERLVRSGHRVTVLTEDTGAADDIRRLGVEVVPLSSQRKGMVAGGVWSAVREVRRALLARPGALLHGFGAFGITIGGAARRGLGMPAVFTVTGRGYVAAEQNLRTRAVSGGIATFSKRVVDGARTRWIVENLEDSKMMGLDRARELGRVVLVGGAGVALDRHPVVAMPLSPPFRLLSSARLIWSKGVDVAVDAIGVVRSEGVPVELTIVGAVDPANPRSYTDADMARFAATPGITLAGFRNDVPQLLTQHHAGLLASRGGEGVPKGLIEAAASARPIVTTNVPGCRELAIETGGWLAEPGDVRSLATAIKAAAMATDLTPRGLHAREVVAARYTQDAVWSATYAIYNELAASG